MTDQPRTLADLRAAAVEAHRRGDLGAARADYLRYLAVAPRDAGAWSNLGALFRAQGDHDLALRAHDRASALAPEDPGIRVNRANLLSDIGRYDEALALRRTLARGDKPVPDQTALIGRALRAKGDTAGAIAFLSKAHAEFPEDPEIELQLAFAHLETGDFARGFAHHEARWHTGDQPPLDLPFRRWRGEDLAGRTILLAHEQGLGEAILMLRCLPWLRRRCARVVCLTRPPLLRLLTRLPGADLVTTEMPEGEKFDHVLPLMDLPLFGLKGRADIPPPVRLNVPEEAANRAARILRPYRDDVRIGVVWSGADRRRDNVFRSFPHRDLLPLSDRAGVQLFSLYKGPRAADLRADGSAAFIVDVATSDRDLADCAAMMQGMDLVVTCDTAAAHLAGSLGVPTWVILHWDPFWLYGRQGRETPWYPGMRLFRQRSPRDWAPVMMDVAAALDEVLETMADG